MRINITEKLQQERPVLEIRGKAFEIDNRKDTVFSYTEKDFKDKKSDEIIQETIRHFAGEKALKEVLNMKELSFHDYQMIFYAVIALAMEITLEEAEERFQNSRKTEA